jgi:hypothetical protein
MSPSSSLRFSRGPDRLTLASDAVLLGGFAKMGLKSRLLPATAVWLILAPPASADSLDRSAFDFESLKQHFERQDAERRADGLVLERLRNQQGQAHGRLSLGGDVTHRDPYEGTAGAVNFRGRTNEELGSSIINLRVSF